MTTNSRIRPGDVMLVTPGHDSLTRMIARYDGSPFSHVGIALGDDLVASCRTDDDVLASGEIGGVRIDTFDFFQKNRRRDLYHAPLVGVDAAARTAALRRARAWAEDGTRELSSFSFAKMFQCAVAVMASGAHSGLDPAVAGKLVDLAVEAGRAWEWDPERPSFFCAEFVVTAFGWEFGRDALRPADVARPDEPAPEPAPERPAASSPPRLGQIVRLARNLLHYRSSPVEDWTMLQLVHGVRDKAPQFWRESVDVLLEYFHGARRVSGHRGGFLDDDSLPAGLVTPRMIAASGRVHPPRLVPGGPGG